MPVIDRVAPIKADGLDAATGSTSIRHGFFTRLGGASTGLYESLNVGLGSDDAQHCVAENRRRVAAFFEREPSSLSTVHQVHSAHVVTVEAPFSLEERPRADAMVTRAPGVVLGVLTADCGPLLFADPEAGVVGAAHAGWRGAFAGIAENTIAAMVALGAERDRIIASLGPSISADHYEVGADFRDRFLADNAKNERFFTPSAKAGHLMFDLPAYTLARITAAGVRADWTGQCTYADEARFFSYRRATHRQEPDYGRQMAAIAITE